MQWGKNTTQLRFNTGPFKPWEVILMVLAIIIFLISFHIYLNDISLRKLLLDQSIDDSEPLVGKVSSKNGVIRREASGESEFSKIEIDTQLRNMDLLVTSEASNATLKFDDGSIVELGPNTMVRIAFPPSSILENRDNPARLEIVSGQVTGQAGVRKLIFKIGNQSLNVSPHAAQMVAVKRSPLQTEPIIKNSEVPAVSHEQEALPLLPPESQSPPIPETELTAASDTTSMGLSPNSIQSAAATPNFGKLAMASLEPQKHPITQSQPSARTSPFNEGSLASLKRQSPNHPQSTASLPKVAVSARQSHLPETHRPQAHPLTTRLKQPSQPSQTQALQTQIPKVQSKAAIRPSSPSSTNGTQLPSAHMKSVQSKVVPKSETGPKLKEIAQAPKASNPNPSHPSPSQATSAASATSSTSQTSQVSESANDASLAPLVPILAKPRNEVKIMKEFVNKIGNRLLFTWSEVKDTTSYEFEMSQDPKFAKIFMHQTAKEHYHLWLKPQVGQYWWRVRRNTKDGASVTSAISTFTITP